MKLNLFSGLIISSIIMINPTTDLLAQNGGVGATMTNPWRSNGNKAQTSDFIGTLNDVPLRFRANGQEYMTLSPDGLLGLGITTPEARLDVNGSAIFRSDLLIPNLKDVNGNPEYFLTLDAKGQVNRGGMDKLLTLLYAPMPAQMPCLSMPDGTLAPMSPVWNNKIDVLYTSSQCIPNLRVGIGTENPVSRLDVRGTGTFTKMVIGNLSSSSSTARLYVKYVGSASDASEVMLIENNQRRLLQLNNNGLLYAREVKVNLNSSWPDYVFEKNYPLMPLDEVKNYIEQNKHLPDVPSANQVEQEGINVSDHSAIMMRKVEELTLYILQLQDQLKEQQVLLNKQQEAIRTLQQTKD